MDKLCTSEPSMYFRCGDCNNVSCKNCRNGLYGNRKTPKNQVKDFGFEKTKVITCTDSESDLSGPMSSEVGPSNNDDENNSTLTRSRSKNRLLHFLRSKSRRRYSSDEAVPGDVNPSLIFLRDSTTSSSNERACDDFRETDSSATDDVVVVKVENPHKAISSIEIVDSSSPNANAAELSDEKLNAKVKKVEQKELSKKRFPRLQRLKLWMKRSAEHGAESKEGLRRGRGGASSPASKYASGSRNPYELAAASLQSVVLPSRPKAKSLMPLEVRDWDEDEKEEKENEEKNEKGELKDRSMFLHVNGDETPDQRLMKCWLMSTRGNAPKLIVKSKEKWVHPNLPGKFGLVTSKTKAEPKKAENDTSLSSMIPASLTFELDKDKCPTSVRIEREVNISMIAESSTVQIESALEAKVSVPEPDCASPTEQDSTVGSAGSFSEVCEEVRVGSKEEVRSRPSHTKDENKNEEKKGYGNRDEDFKEGRLGVKLWRMESGEVIDVFPALAVDLAIGSGGVREEIPVAEVVVKSCNPGGSEKLDSFSMNRGWHGSEPRTPQARASRRVSFSDLVEMVTFTNGEMSHKERMIMNVNANTNANIDSHEPEGQVCESENSSFEFDTGTIEQVYSWDAAVRQVSFMMGSNVSIRVPTDMVLSSPKEDKATTVERERKGKGSADERNERNERWNEGEDEGEEIEDGFKITRLYRSFSMPEAPLRAQAVLAAERLKEAFDYGFGDNEDSFGWDHTDGIPIPRPQVQRTSDQIRRVDSEQESPRKEPMKETSGRPQGQLNLTLGSTASFHTIPVVVLGSKPSVPGERSSNL